MIFFLCIEKLLNLMYREKESNLPWDLRNLYILYSAKTDDIFSRLCVKCAYLKLLYEKTHSEIIYINDI